MTFRRSWPLVLTVGVGFQWPTLGPSPISPPTSRLRASSPRLDQGGIVKTLMQGASLLLESNYSVSTPQSGFDRRRLASAFAFAAPTTPASAGPETSLPVILGPVPSLVPHSADAAASHVPLAPTRTTASRVWSAPADDDGERSEFPLEPPSFALWRRPALKRAITNYQDLSVALLCDRQSLAISGPRRYR